MSSHPNADGANSAPSEMQLRIYRIQPGTKATILTLSPKYCGLMTHWVRGRSEYCRGRECRSDWHRLDTIWKGYAPVERYDETFKAWIPEVLEISEALELHFRGRFARGQLWELSRPAARRGENPPICGKLVNAAYEGEVPLAHPYIPALRTLYHSLDIELGVANPMPGRAVVQPRVGPPPRPAGAAEELPPTPEQFQKLRSFLGRDVKQPKKDDEAK
jgi:hypothetical protein